MHSSLYRYHAIHSPGDIGAAAASVGYGGVPGQATPGAATTCYDNGNNGSKVMAYSVEISNGSNVNCALSQFQ